MATLCEWRHWGRPLQRLEFCTGEKCTAPSIPLQAGHHLLGPFRLRPGMLWPPLDCQWPNRLISPGHTDTDSDSPGVGGRNPLERSGWRWELEVLENQESQPGPALQGQRLHPRAVTLAGSKALGLVCFPCFLIWLAEKISQEPSLSPCSLWEGRLCPWLSTAAGQCDHEA